MRHSKLSWVTIFGLAAGLVLILSARFLAQEHPKEHPTAKKEQKKTGADVTVADMAKAIKNYVNKDTELKGGYFLIYDPVNKKTLELTLEKVHEEKLSRVGEELYFACSDFKATDGQTYDLDFFMKGGKLKLDVSEVSIHKEAGQPRYGWVQQNGLWKKKPSEEPK